MKNRFTFAFAFAFASVSAAALLLSPRLARAQQIDTNPPLPNVLILLDNSGSMERMIDGTLPESNPANACNCDPVLGACNWSQAPQPNRWNVVQQALTGSLQNGFNCVAMPRGPTSVFASEYQIAGILPYDTNYYLPFHRMVAQDNSNSPSVPCVVAPGALPGAATPGGVGVAGTGAGGSATDFAGSIITRPYNQFSATPNSCQFTQLSNGAVNTMTDLMRFGLMTFDQDPSAATGVVTASSPLTVANPAFTGMWSYFPGWDKGQACTYFGNPAGCVGPAVPMAVGARNRAAPPWEGRMVGFPSTNAISDQETNNGQIGSVVVASRPYGATPMAGMLTGAQYYFQADPTGPAQTDPYVQGGCRNEYMILLTDGAPNDDMRPGCMSSVDAGVGTCPFAPPEDIVASLYNNGLAVGSQQFVKTYVVGFAVSTVSGDQGQPANCSSLVEGAGGLPAGLCDPTSAAGQNPSPALAACCKLQQIAFNGGSNQAYFADTPGDLQKALGAILADISKQATTRTTPAFSPVLTSAPSSGTALQTSASSFLASFNPSPGVPWSGDVQRQRLACSFSSSTSSFTVPQPTITPTLGDDFADNLNSGTSPRTFLALEPGPWNGSTTGDSTQTIRPFVATGVGDTIPPYSATALAGQAVNVLPQITPDALGIPLTGAHPGCQYTPSNAPGPAYLTPLQCRDMLLDFTFAQSSFVGPSDFTFVSRSANAFGDVFHASPVVVGPPGALLRDPSYDAFRATWNAVPATSGRGAVANGSTTKPRDTVVYVATNDGLLHAFWADETKEENNEEWSLLPPAVMPNLLSSYPSSHQFLLDGTPVVKDVVWERTTGNLDTTVANPWHTMLVAGFGPYQRGYYAVDVTNPDASGLVSGSSTLNPPGPVFRWQLTKMPATNYPIFAGQSAIPAITTLFMDPGDGVAREIGVAILPGGVDVGGPSSSALGGPSCARAATSSLSAPLGTFPARDAVRCWNSHQKSTDVVNGRALTIARLDTGEILQVFARKADVLTFPSDTLLATGRIRDTPLDSPMTGTPIVYPSDVGAAATKIFVGDADGTIWRFDVSSTEPANWTGQLYLDLYNKQVDTSTTAWADGQPFQVPMVASLDTAGELVLNAATGSTETFDTNGTNYLYSVTEKVQGTPALPRAFVNWYFGPQSTPVALRPGERVSGPMTVFDGTLYFATYAAASSSTVSCSSGSARLFGWDFVLPFDTTCSPTDPLASCNRGQGGVRELQIPPAAPPDFVDPTVTNGAQAGAVIPGVSIQATPACGSISAATTDNYVPGGTHRSLSNVTAQTYSLFAQVGGKSATGTGAATGQVNLPVPTPGSPTVIDSWAAVLE